MALGAARMLLEPLLLEYLKRYPAMALEVVTEGALVDVIGQGFDAGFRLAEVVPPDMIAVPVEPSTRMIVVGAPSYFKRRERPKRPQDLTQHACINIRLPTLGGIYAWEFERRGRPLKVRVDGQLVFNSTPLRIKAALAGLGLAYVAEDQVRAPLAKGQLVQVLDDWCAPFPGYHFYYPSRRQSSSAFALLVDALRYRG